ncbi:MAG TPA: DUF151 domain-containing protein [Bdellovibrionales bacterium]|nr:DUF151 domain-containing protein [Bdellovibrionales bacterium]
MKKLDLDLKPTDEVIELEAFGLTNSMEAARPVMLFREKKGEAVLPVWLSPLDAGIAITQHQPQSFMLSPHDVTVNVLKELGVKVDSCFFRELKGHQQYVDLIFSGSRKLRTLRARADHAISFCLQAGAKFYCTRAYLEECRQVNAEMTKMPVGALRADMKRAKHQYMN